MSVEWKEPPPPRRMHKAGEHLAQLRELQARPEQWAVVMLKKTTGQGWAHTQRLKSIIGTYQLGTYEFRVRKVGEAAVEVFARFMAPPDFAECTRCGDKKPSVEMMRLPLPKGRADDYPRNPPGPLVCQSCLAEQEER